MPESKRSARQRVNRTSRRSWNSSASTPSALSPWTRCRRPTADIPGTPMALAPLAFVLWDRYLRHNPRNPQWPGRDRFILSNGHACMLLYSMLYLTGYDLSLDDIKQFRQWGSKTPGHPEYRPRARPRSHDRPARTRRRQFGRYGDRAALAGFAASIRTVTLSSITGSTPFAVTAT